MDRSLCIGACHWRLHEDPMSSCTVTFEAKEILISRNSIVVASQKNFKWLSRSLWNGFIIAYLPKVVECCIVSPLGF